MDSEQPLNPLSTYSPLSTTLCLTQLTLVLAGTICVMVHYISKLPSILLSETMQEEVPILNFSSASSLFDELEQKSSNGDVVAGSPSSPLANIEKEIEKEKDL